MSAKTTRAAIFAMLSGLATGVLAQEHMPEMRMEDPENPESAYLEPYIDVMPSHPVDIDGLERTVFFVFSPECKASWTIHRSVREWGQTLPEGWRFIEVPVAGPTATAPALVSFASRKAARENGEQFNEPEFWDLLYEAVQEQRIDMEDIEGTIDIAVRAGASEQKVREAIQSRETYDATVQAANVMRRYRVDRTPVLIVADSYLTHPDLVGANPLDVLRIGNVLISKAIEEVSEEQQ